MSIFLCDNKSTKLLAVFITFFYMIAALAMLGFGTSIKLNPISNSGPFCKTNDEITLITTYNNHTIPIFMIVMGVLAFFSAIIFVVAIFLESPVLLKTTIFLFVLLIFANIALIVTAATYPSKNVLRKRMLRNMISNFKKQDVINNGSLISGYPQDSIARSWATLQIETKCCGVDGRQDYITLTPQQRSESIFPGEGDMEIDFPLSCCQVSKDDNYRMKIDDINSCISLTKPSHFHHKGCLDTTNAYYTYLALPAYRLAPILIAFQVALLAILIMLTFCNQYQEIK